MSNTNKRPPQFRAFAVPDYQWDHMLICPSCGYDYAQVINNPYTVPGEDSGGRSWGGRGDAFYVPFWGECGHVWALTFGFHKGQTMLSAALLTPEELDYEQAVEFIKRQAQHGH